MKSLRTVVFALGFVVLGAPGVARFAQGEPASLHLNITPFGGYSDFAKEVNLDDRPEFGGRLGIGFGRYIGIEGYYAWMSTHTKSGSADSLFVATPASRAAEENVSVSRYGADLILNLIPSSGFNPYLLGGWFEDQVKTKDRTTNTKQFFNGIEFGGGVKLGVSKRAALRFEVRDKLWSFGESSRVPDPPGNDKLSNLVYTGGIQLTLGGLTSHDEDKDGIKDKDDKCPGTPLGARVDESGCPIDSDHDNVPDGIDQCPNTPEGATVDARGCPSDGDGDGVPDGIDRCPTTVAGAAVDARGCSQDTDGDNIPDGLDRCPDTPPGVLVDPRGCPKDSDGDQIPDGLDRCSDTPRGATVDALGCPGDEDGDGVLDGLDQCPRTPAGAVVNASGCAQGQTPNRPTPSGAQPPPQPSPAPAPAAAPPQAAPRAGAARPNVAAQPPPAGQRPAIDTTGTTGAMSGKLTRALPGNVNISIPAGGAEDRANTGVYILLIRVRGKMAPVLCRAGRR